jgi:hypothetical protein
MRRYFFINIIFRHLYKLCATFNAKFSFFKTSRASTVCSFFEIVYTESFLFLIIAFLLFQSSFLPSSDVNVCYLISLNKWRRTSPNVFLFYLKVEEYK